MAGIGDKIKIDATVVSLINDDTMRVRIQSINISEVEFEEGMITFNTKRVDNTEIEKQKSEKINQEELPQELQSK